eukprot:3024694-Rhodomonas_salina.3
MAMTRSAIYVKSKSSCKSSLMYRLKWTSGLTTKHAWNPGQRWTRRERAAGSRSNKARKTVRTAVVLPPVQGDSAL